jgi:HipA N-terminal domain
MIKHILKLFKSEEGQEDFYTPTDVEVVFSLTYRALEIGTLSLNEGQWTFQYSESFKKQDKIKPLLDFPNVNRKYTSEELYPFFIQRIPGVGQNARKFENLSEVDLLKKFGKQTISNPFVLQAV